MNKYLPLLLLFLCIDSVAIHKTATNKKRTPVAKKQTDSRTIIFDATNVLFQENKSGFVEKIGMGRLTSYAITHWKNPGHTTLDTLDKISRLPNQKPPVSFTICSRTMPRCIVELQQGTKTCAQVQMELEQCIEQLAQEKYFGSEKERKIVQEIITLILNPDEVSLLTKPVKPMVKMMKKLKNDGHNLYLFANVPQEIFTSLKKTHPEIIQLFDGVVISSQVKMVKPDPNIFKYLISKHKLTPEKCIIIDEQKESIHIAQELGMKGIVYKKPQKVACKMKKFGITV